MMPDDDHHTPDRNFLKATLLPFASGINSFHDNHDSPPPKTFDSPFFQSKHCIGVVTIQ